MQAIARRRINQAAGPRRGQVFTAQEVAHVLSVKLERVEWHCRAAERAGAASFFFGVWKEGEEWMIPERALRRAIGGMVHQHYKVEEVALLMGYSPGTIRRRMVIVPQGVDFERARPAHMIGARMPLGSDARIPASELDRLADGLPDVPREEDQP